MERVITSDIGDNFVVGQVYDQLQTTWDHLATNVGKPLHSFSRPVADVIRESIEPRKRGRSPKQETA